MIRKVFPILAVSMFSSMLGIGIIVPLLPIYANELGATGIWIGIIFAGYSVSRSIVMPFIGRLSDRHGRKLFICIGLMAYGITSLGFVWSDTVYQLALVRFIQGAAGGIIIPIAQAYIGDLAPEGEEGKWMGYLNAAFFTGFGLGPLIGGIMTEQFGMDSAFYTMMALNVMSSIIAIIRLPDIRGVMMSSQLPPIKTMFASARLKGLFSFRIGDAQGRGAFITFLPILAGATLNLGPFLIGILVAANTLFMSVLQLYSGKMADRFDRRTMVIMGSIVRLGTLAFIPFTHSFWPLFGLCVFNGLGGAISVPAASALTIEEGRTFGMGSTMSMFMLAMSIGMIVGPLLGGAIADWVSINAVFYFAAGLGLLGVVLFGWFTR